MAATDSCPLRIGVPSAGLCGQAKNDSSLWLHRKSRTGRHFMNRRLQLTDRTASIRSFGVASRYVEAKSEAHASLQIGFASRRPAFTCGVARRYAERRA
ncbi:MAG: hypothetical protein LBR08_10575 [Bacteroidales bacterium]|nr:hypothetical protein [Bacteroidales bacterium]